jgi:uncharacterized protein (DUF1800 family)
MIDVADNALKGLVMGIKEVGMQKRGADENQRRKDPSAIAEDLKSLNITWLNLMVNSEQQLREKMSLFWHGAFCQSQY